MEKNYIIMCGINGIVDFKNNLNQKKLEILLMILIKVFLTEAQMVMDVKF